MRMTSDSDELLPHYIHRWTFPEAITTIAHNGNLIYAGTVSGALLTYDLTTYEQIDVVQAHTGSILTMCFTENLLFTGSCDSLIKVWVPKSQEQLDKEKLAQPNKPSCSLACLHLLYTNCDIGDIYSLTYDPTTSTLYFGTQNASVHWVRIDDHSLELQRTNETHKMPALRPSKFFDSLGPGGKIAPQQQQTLNQANTPCEHQNYNLIEVPLDNQISFAHHGPVYTLIIDPQRRQLISGSGDGCIKIWQLEDCKPTLMRTIEIQESVLSMTLASHWQLCCGLDVNGFIILDLETYQIMPHHLDSGPIISIAAVEDNIFLSSNTEIITYDATTTKKTQFTTSGTVTAVATLPPISTGQLISGGTDGIISLWNIRFIDEEDSDETNRNDDTLTLRTSKFKIEPLSNEEMFNFLRETIKFQSVSRRDCLNWSECRNCATHIRDHMRVLGGEAHLLSVECANPIVYAQFKADIANPKRVLFYGHYDVIEADKAWLPFNLASINGYFYGRGVADNKGPLAASLYAVAKLKQQGKLNCDVVFAIEGEEESGSYKFIDTVSKYKQLFGEIDWIIFSNSAWLDDKTPCINYGLRGVISFELTINSQHTDLHSGVDGGMFREPTIDMITLLSKLSDGDRIQIPKFYTGVQPLNNHEQQLLDAICANTDVKKEDLIKRWRMPSLTVHQLNFSGPHNNTVISATVKANISFRLVPNQTASNISNLVTKFLESQFASLNSPNTLNIKTIKKADPWIGDTTNNLYKVMDASVQKVWGKKPFFIREGGSIPSSRALEILFNAPAAQLPCSQSNDNAHLDHERMRVTNLINARLTFEEIFKNL